MNTVVGRQVTFLFFSDSRLKSQLPFKLTASFPVDFESTALITQYLDFESYPRFSAPPRSHNSTQGEDLNIKWF